MYVKIKIKSNKGFLPLKSRTFKGTKYFKTWKNLFVAVLVRLANKDNAPNAVVKIASVPIVIAHKFD